MKKLSQINEGMWSKTFDRARTGDERIENKIITNIDEIKPVELHDKLKLRFADDILIYDNKDIFTEKEMLELQDGFLKKFNDRPGFNFWYVPHEGNIKDMLKIKSIKYLEDENGNLVIRNNRTKTEIKTNAKIFWCNSMMGLQVWIFEHGRIEIFNPKYLFKKEASILLYR